MKITIDLDCTKADIEHMIDACNATIHRVPTFKQDALMIDVKTVLRAIERELPR